MDTAITKRLQLSAPGAKIELFDLDFTPVNSGIGVLRWYPGSAEDSPLGTISWRGNLYEPHPVEIDEIDVSGAGSLPRPKIKVSNVKGDITTLIRNVGSIGGAILTRWQTFTDYLDGQPDANPNGYLPLDVFILDRIVTLNKQVVEVECRSVLDFEREQLPAREMLQSACRHIYRVWNGAEFTYKNVSCPYTGTASFTAIGENTSQANDQCGKRLSDCKLRFPNSPLPTRAFPGAGRYT